jgi:hypothetical protein
MRKLNCRPGDLAITVEAYNTINIGSIVRVLHKHHNQSALVVEPDDFLWYVEAAHYLTYSRGLKFTRRKRGAAPDSYLRPIRGNPLGKDIAVQVVESIDRQEGKALDALGVEIIEGEHPGSSYYAAELRQDVNYANQVAREMGLEFKYRLV